MSGAVIYTDMGKIDEVGKAYVENGTPALKAERQRDVDGAKAFLLSDAAMKLRPYGLQPRDAQVREPARTVLEASRRG